MTTTAAPKSLSPPSPENKPAATPSVAKRAGRATLMMMGFVLLSRVLGIVRDIVLAHLFGQNELTTIYTAAFRVPDLLMQLVAGGALAPVFVPVFVEYWHTERQEDAWKIFRAVTTIVAVAVAVAIVLMEIFVVPMTHWVNPLFSTDAVQQTAALSRILLPAQWCFFVGGIMMGVLNARERFLIPAIGPVIYNAGIILGGLLFHGKLGIASMTIGAVAGAFFGNFLLPAWQLWRIGGKYSLSFDTLHPGVRQVGRLMLPALIGLSLSQLTFYITGFFLPADARLSALRNANNLTQAPIGVFAQASAIVLFPTIAMLAAQKDWTRFREEINQGIRRIFFLTIPASALMAVLAEPIIAFLYLGKKFGADDVHIAATALWCYSLATFAWSAQAVLARGFYSLQDTKTPVVITTFMVFVFAGLCALVRVVWRDLPHQPNPALAAGLALAASIVATLNMIAFLFTLQKKVGGLNLRGILISGMKITVAAVAGSGVSYFLVKYLSSALPVSRLTSAITLLLAGAVGIFLYAVFCYLLRVPELRTVRDMFRRLQVSEQ